MSPMGNCCSRGCCKKSCCTNIWKSTQDYVKDSKIVDIILEEGETVVAEALREAAKDKLLNKVQKMSANMEEDEDRAESFSSCLSMRSSWSKYDPLDFSNERGPSHTQVKRQRTDSTFSSCLSMRSDWSKHDPPDFSNGPGPLDTKVKRQNAESDFSSCLSMKSDRSKDHSPFFSNEPGLSDTKKRKLRDVSVEDHPSCCALCEDLLKDPVSSSCGHFSSHWDQDAPSRDWCCPQCGQTINPLLQTARQTSTAQEHGDLQKVLNELKISLKRRYARVMEGTEYQTGSGTLLNRIFTELNITEGQSDEVNTQHEVRKLERDSKRKILHHTPIRCQDIFKTFPNQQEHTRDKNKPIKFVLTNGIAGIGKTFSVQKFTLDWAEGLENQDVSLVIPLSFRELNLIKDEQYSLLELLHVFQPTLQKVTAEQLAVCKVLFIFDGLDESRLSLDFTNNEVVSDVTQKSSVNMLLTNLIQGKLLPSALIWITSRPAAANEIPPKHVDRVTEVRGFTETQQEEYVKKKVSDKEKSSSIISHIKACRTLHIMCLIPVFCWITATVLEHMLTTDQRGELPKTLTGMYSHFLLVQMKRKKQKYKGHDTMSPEELTEADRKVLLALGRLAFEQLLKGHAIFYQEDLERCCLDATEASVYSEVCTKMFRRESVICQKTVYSFLHVGIQEFLAAVYTYHCLTSSNTEVLKGFLGEEYANSSLEDFLKSAMEKSLESKNGHLDLLTRFLHGLSLESNQRLLRGLLRQTDSSPETIQRVIDNLKQIGQKD